MISARNFKLACGVLALLSLAFGSLASAQVVSSTNFTIQGPLIKKGSGFATSSSFHLWGSLGEEAIGLSSSGTFTIQSGFLYVPSALLNVQPSQPGATSAPSGQTITVGGGGGIFFPIKREIKGFLAVDLNQDGFVNLIDLSILLYHFEEKIPLNIARYDFVEDGVVDVLDVSIMLYYWTG